MGYEFDFENEVVEDTSSTPKKPSRYSVVLLNCDFVEFGCVIRTLQSCFHIDGDGVMMLASTAHEHGQATIATYTKDIAETKAEMAYQQLCQFHSEINQPEPSRIFDIIPYSEDE